MALRDTSLPDEIIMEAHHLKQEIGSKTISGVRKELRKDNNWDSHFKNILYRPFDVRSIYYSPLLIDRPRFEIMRHMLQSNMAMLLPRRASEWHHALVTDTLAVDVAISSASREANYLFPLYLYDDENPGKKRSSATIMMLFEPKEDYGTKKPNLSPHLVSKLTESYKRTPSPDLVFFYAYAVLYSNTYRAKYAEFLRADFPRIPFTANHKLFNKMAGYGQNLVEWHLLNSRDIELLAAKVQGGGSNKIEKIWHEKNKVYINEDRYFESVPLKIWEYQVGGYQVCDKWLKDRKEKTMSLEDVKQYCWIVTALKKTMDIQEKIDAIYPDVEKEIIDFSK